MMLTRPKLSAALEPATPLASEPGTLLPPVSVNTRSRYLITRNLNGSFGVELRAHNGSALLSADRDAESLELAHAAAERIRRTVQRANEALAQGRASTARVDCRQSLTGKWYFVVCDGEQLLASSRPFDYRSRMDKALYAMRACAPGSRVQADE